MKQKLLLTVFIACINLAVNAQKTSVYAITGSQKGQNNWTEVRLVDIASGQELKTVFKNSDETQPLNARTGKPVVKKQATTENLQFARISPNVIRDNGPDNNPRIVTISRDTRPEARRAPLPENNVNVKVTVPAEARIATPATPYSEAVKVAQAKEGAKSRIIIKYDGQVIELNGNGTTIEAKDLQRVKELEGKIQSIHVMKVNDQLMRVNENMHNVTRDVQMVKELEGKMQAVRTQILFTSNNVSSDKPFSTYSAACAYDKKHERLYYTPMGIAQLRYIDLKAKTPQVYYFEDEQFGALQNRGDISNQITRMVIGANGNGYALTNNADHLIQFTTDKKATITDLGGLTDDPANGKFTVHSAGGYGGDIIASKAGDLFLITANHNVFQINIKNLTAAYKGTIQGLPRGYSTNGAAVEEGSMVLVNSSNSTEGYYRFDINTMVAEKVENGGQVYNASDLANANLLTVKKESKEEKPAEVVPVPEQAVEIAPIKDKPVEEIPATRLGVYPNPVTNGVVNLLMDNYTAGKYQAKLIDVTGKQLSSKSFTIVNKSHTEPFNLPASIAKGNYLIQLYDHAAQGAGTVKLVIQ